MESEHMLTPGEKSPLPENFSSEDDQTSDAASRRTASPTYYQRAIPAPASLLVPPFLPISTFDFLPSAALCFHFPSDLNAHSPVLFPLPTSTDGIGTWLPAQWLNSHRYQNLTNMETHRFLPGERRRRKCLDPKVTPKLSQPYCQH